jgi:hypothetical protein
LLLEKREGVVEAHAGIDRGVRLLGDLAEGGRLGIAPVRDDLAHERLARHDTDERAVVADEDRAHGVARQGLPRFARGRRRSERKRVRHHRVADELARHYG